MSGEISRSGLSNPINIFQENLLIPQSPTDLQIDSWGLQAINPPEELAKIKLKWKAPTNFKLNVIDGNGDNQFSSEIVGNVDGTFSTNDTEIDTKTDLTSFFISGDKIKIGEDPTIYTIVDLDNVSIEIQYGLLMDISIDNLEIYKLTKIADSPTTSRLLTFNMEAEKNVTIFGYGGFEYRGSWTGIGQDLEWEDLNKIGLTINNENLNYWIKNSTNILLENNITGKTIIELTNEITNISINDYISFGSNFDTFYLVVAISENNLTISTPLLNNQLASDTIWIKQVSGVSDYSTQFNKDDFHGISEMINLSGYRLYYKLDIPLSDIDSGILLKTLSLADVSISSDGFTSYIFNADDETWNSVKPYFGILAFDTDGNESDLTASAFCITYPGQAIISNSSLIGDQLTITYENITDNEKNPHLAHQMGSGETSINGGYDVFLIDYIDLAIGTYAGKSATEGIYYNDTLVIGDIIYLFDIKNNVKWVAHCLTTGEVSINDNNLIYGNITTYIGDSSPLSIDVKGQYLRITDRENQSVITKDSAGRKEYLTDSKNTFVVTINLNKSQGVVIESVDTEVTSGVTK